MGCAITILAVDDEQDFLDSIKRAVVAAGFQPPVLETNPETAASFFDEESITIDVAFLDITMPGMNGEELLEVIRSKSPDTECIMLTAINDASTAVRCLKKGAYDYLVKPISPDDLIRALNRALERKRLLGLVEINKKRSIPVLKCVEAFAPIRTTSSNMLKVMKEAELHAISDVPILITGESGTGKELLARAVHAASPRVKFPFMAVNMASQNNTLFDAEFYGHTKGAFTGATQDRKGYLEFADRGTLFLDEIGSTPIDIQGKLLRVLQEGEYLKLGTSKSCQTNVRIVTATNANLDNLLASGNFRNDFYYRLKGAWLHVPPLRERKEDIPVLIQSFMHEFAAQKETPEISEKAMSILLNYHYPGNIRELKYIIQGALNLAQDKQIIPAHLPAHLKTGSFYSKNSQGSETLKVDPLKKIELQHILKIYNQTGKNKTQTAEILQIGLNTLRRKLKSCGEE
ncbi:MAG: sigma-54 dependent transcriptional regulator [Desulfobulbaceae bacterium]|nr:sigma-54 dependent transcriptional regulator [Desulfobulbaceae bacterium]